MKETRRFRYSKDLLPFIKQILEENAYSYEVEDGQIKIVGISGRKFHKVVREAMCLRQESSYKIPHGVLPFEKWVIRKEREKKQSAFNGMPVALLNEDLWKLEKSVSSKVL